LFKETLRRTEILRFVRDIIKLKLIRLTKWSVENIMSRFRHKICSPTPRLLSGLRTDLIREVTTEKNWNVAPHVIKMTLITTTLQPVVEFTSSREKRVYGRGRDLIMYSKLNIFRIYLRDPFVFLVICLKPSVISSLDPQSKYNSTCI
jgi:hypothetical protein